MRLGEGQYSLLDGKGRSGEGPSTTAFDTANNVMAEDGDYGRLRTEVGDSVALPTDHFW